MEGEYKKRRHTGLFSVNFVKQASWLRRRSLAVKDELKGDYPLGKVLSEDASTKKSARKMMVSRATINQYLAGVSCSLGTAMVGAGFVLFTPIMEWITGPDSVIPISNSDLAWLVAVAEIGEALGPLPAGYVADKWGRKVSVLLTFPLMLVYSGIMILTRNVIALFIARVILGMATGMLFTVTPMYLAEIADPRIRGEISCIIGIMWYVGTIISFGTGPYVSYDNYLYIGLVPAVLFVATFIFMPETPFYLMMSSREEEAKSCLRWLRAKEDVNEEFKEMMATISVQNQGNTSWKKLFTSPECRKSCIVISFMVIIKYTCGQTPISNYANKTFASASSSILSPHIIAILYVILQIVSSLVSLKLLDICGRKPLVIYSLLFMFLSTGMIAVYFYLHMETSINVTNYSWILYLCFIINCAAGNLGINPVQLTLQAEYFPFEVRASAGAFSTLLSNICIFTSLKQYQVMEDTFGLYSNYIFFSVVCLIGLVTFIPLLKETSGKHLE